MKIKLTRTYCRLEDTIKELRNEIKDKSFDELMENENRFFTNVYNEEDSLFDFDYDCLNGTILNKCGIAELSNSFTLWSSDGQPILDFEIEE